MISSQCVKEARELRALAQSSLAKGDKAQAQRLESHRSELLQVGLSSDELRAKYTEAVGEEATAYRSPARYRDLFHRYLSGKVAESEFRDFLVGGGGDLTIAYTQLTQGGPLVPFDYLPKVYEGMAQVDQILDADVSDFIMSPSAALPPMQVSGYDLSTITAQLVAEANQQNPQTVPTISGATLAENKIFKVTFAASLEAEEDIPNFVAKIVRAVSIAFGRTIGQRVLSGKGGSDISGIFYNINGGVATQQNTTPGSISLTDINNFYFALDRWYRSQAKTAWLVSDGAYKKLRAAVDGSNRPLLDIIDDQERLLGKPVYVSPGLSHSSIGSITDSIIFGDLSHIVVRASAPQIKRSIEQGQVDITKGEVAYIARMRADATLFDPTNGATPPLVLCNIR
jgi:HK97 family phage major capsid protein